ncbi:MAG: type I-F CRISPR-associated protein Csy3, partial [Gammaproteobacteria bacterium]|nr:type I-F CRISPR-associated protein Csy3 [Gammaproteobacteria bacterium]
MSKKTITKIPSILSFEKKLVPSDGYFYGTTWENRTAPSSQPSLGIIPKSVRGTISNRLKSESKNNLLKINPDISKANLQFVDACALSKDQDTLKISFTLKVLGNIENPSACNDNVFLKQYKEYIQAYKEEYGFQELSKRYALNIANARFLWRNRIGAESIEVIVKIANQKDLIFNSKNYSLNTFDGYDNDPQILHLANQIASALKGNLDYLLLTIEAYARIGSGQEVYPSEELILDNDKSKSTKSKVLYKVNDIAAMHSQKIGNAIRCIDNWYPEFEDKQLVIAADPYGSVTNLGTSFRSPFDKKDFFTLFDKLFLNNNLEHDHEKHYVMAVLIRGGVFGKS